jgi:hypothetical protein
MLGGSVALGVGVALLVGNASVDAWPLSSTVARGGASEAVVAVGAGPGVVWLIFLFFFFFFFFFFFLSSFFSLASLRRKEGGDIRKKVRKMFKLV